MNRLGQILLVVLLLLGQATVLEPAAANDVRAEEAVHAMLPCHSEPLSHRGPHMCCSASLSFTPAAEVTLPRPVRLVSLAIAANIVPLAGMAQPPRTPPPRTLT